MPFMWYKDSFLHMGILLAVLVMFIESMYYLLLLIFKLYLLHVYDVWRHAFHGLHVGVRRHLLGADWLRWP